MGTILSVFHLFRAGFIRRRDAACVCMRLQSVFLLFSMGVKWAFRTIIGVDGFVQMVD